MFLNYFLINSSFFLLFVVGAVQNGFDPEKYARKSVYNAVDRIRHRISTTPRTSVIGSKIDKNIMRTMAIIEAKSAEGRIVMLFCNDNCANHRKQIPLWIREFNTFHVTNSDPISYHYHHRKERFGYYNVDEKLDQNSAIVIYFVLNRAIFYEKNLNEKSAFLEFLTQLELQPIIKPRDYQELDDIINQANECDSNQKYLLRIHNPKQCRDEYWENLVRSFYMFENITFVEVQAPFPNEMAVIIQKRLPELRRNCQILTVLQNGGYKELKQNKFYLKELNSEISNWFNENCSFSVPHKIQPKLTEIQLDYLSEELSIREMESNPTYIVVGAIGGIAVIALAISIFWGLNGNSFVRK